MTDHPQPPAAGGRSRRWLRPLVRWSLLALAVGMVVYLLAGLEWRDLAVRFAAAEPSWMAAAVALLLGRFAVWTWRWQLAVDRLERPPGALPLYLMIMAAAMVNHITPTARVLGGLLRARHLARRSGGPVGRAFGGVLFDQLLHQATMAAVTALGVVGAAIAVGRGRLALGVALGLTAAAALGVLLWLRWREREGGGLERLIHSLAERIGGAGSARRAVAHGREAVDALSDLLEDGRLVAAMVALGGLYALINAGSQWAVFRGLGQEPGFWVVMAAVTLGTAAGAVVGTPGGLGATEAAMIGAFVAFGVDRVDATAASLLYRGLHYATVFGVGTPALIWLEAQRRRAPESEPEPPTP